MNEKTTSGTRKLEELKELFLDLTVSDRLEILLEYSESLPELPPRLQAQLEAGENRISECQTPVHLWLEVDDGQIQIHADVPRQSPTVRGFVGLLAKVLNGSKPTEAPELKPQLLRELGLAEALGMTRTQGLQAILQRVRTHVQRAVETSEYS